MALDLASQADAMGWRNPYHNADHLREVTVNMANLGALNATRNEGVVFDKDDLTIAIALAVSHDLGHDGSTNCVPRLDQKGSPVTTRDGKPELVNVPFLLEDKAIASINIAGRRAGVPEARLRQMRAAILTTDERTGYEILDVVLDPMPNPAKRGALLALRSDPAVLNDPKSLRLATMLRDADLMNSCGISAVDSDRQTARLEQERGLKEGTLRGSGTEYFLGTIARGRFLSPEGQIFQGNLTYPRELNRIRLQTAGLTPVSLAQIEAACNSRSFPGRRARLGRRRLQAAVILSGVIRPCGADAHSNGITNGGGAPWRRPFLPIDYPIAKWRTGYHWLGRRRTFSGYS